LRELFVHKLVPVVVEAMGGAFPELKRDPGRVSAMIRAEEESFNETIDRGLELFAEAAQNGKITAKQAFDLHAPYGFPIDLTKIIGAERGVSVDERGFRAEMEKHKEISAGGGREGAAHLLELPPPVLAELKDKGVQATDDSAKFNAAPIGATVKAIWDGHRLIDTTHGAEAAGQGVAIILDRTCFYAEMGGQVGDTGELRSAGGAIMDIATTRAAGGYVLHAGNMIESHLSVGDHVTATLAGVRPRTERNHTATHLANWALREVLGEEVQQKGSLVDPEKLRFDFSHPRASSDEQIARVEALVSERIEANLPVHAKEAPQEQALKIHGLRAVFGEKYPPMVRVVSIGVAVDELLRQPANPAWRQYSVEFCGGTHLAGTGAIEAFAITSEESVSKGVRRIVALTGPEARAAIDRGAVIEEICDRPEYRREEKLPWAISKLEDLAAVANLPLRSKRRAQRALAEMQQLHKQSEKASRRARAPGVDAVAAAGALLDSAPSLGAGRMIVGEIVGASDDELRSAMDSLKKKSPSHGILLASAREDKVTFVAAVSDDLIARGLKAGDWVREVAKAAGGGGGGRPQMAQAGGKDPSKLPDALNIARRTAMSTVK
jgi:alanyl-tRNA synthetase